MRHFISTIAIFAGLAAMGCGEKPSKVYVTLHGDDEIMVLNGATNGVVDHIPVGKGPAILLDTPNHKKLYTANWVDSNVSAVTIATKAVTSVALDARPFVIAMSPDGKFVYAGLVNQIAVIDTVTDTVVRKITTPTVPMSLIVSPDSKTLYIAFLGNTLEAMDIETTEVIKPEIPVGFFPAWITLSPDGKTLYTLNFVSSDITVVDTDAWSVTGTVSTGAGSNPIIGEPTPDGKVLGVTNIGSLNASLIDSTTNAVLHTINLEGRPIGIGFNDAGNKGYITDFGAPSKDYEPFQLLLAGLQGAPFPFDVPGTLTVFDPTTGAVTATAQLGSAPSSVVVISE